VGGPAMIKRQKEIKRLERAQEKAAKRLDRKKEKEQPTRGADGAEEDPDLAGIVPGPQPLPE